MHILLSQPFSVFGFHLLLSRFEESEFSEILEDKEGFENVVIHCLKEDLSRYGERGEYAADAEVIIDEKKKATVLKCDIHGAISERVRVNTMRHLNGF